MQRATKAAACGNKPVMSLYLGTFARLVFELVEVLIKEPTVCASDTPIGGQSSRTSLDGRSNLMDIFTAGSSKRVAALLPTECPSQQASAR